MASILAKDCDKCIHNEVCVYKDAYKHIVSHISDVTFSPPNMYSRSLVDFEFISQVTIHCAHHYNQGVTRNERSTDIDSVERL